MQHHYQLLVLYLLSIFLLHQSSSSISLSNGVELPSVMAHTIVPGWEKERVELLELHWERWPRRFLAEEPAIEPVGEPAPNPGPVIVLAAGRTSRKDPLNGFKKYTNGWNISERHYWASVAYTAMPVFSVAAAWFLGFGLCLLFITLCYFCCERRSYGYSRMCHALSLVFLIISSLAAIIGCVVLYAGQDGFHRSTTKTLEYVVQEADITLDKLRNMSDYLAAAKQIGIDEVFLPSNVQTDIDQIETRINSSASNLQTQTTKSSNDIQDFLDSVRVTLIIVAAIVLLLVLLGLFFSIFGIQLLVYILVITGWILVTGTFILCGIFLLLHNVAADTCVAMDEWVRYPAAHTALDHILPCVDSTTAQATVERSKEVTLQLVDLINQVLTNVSNINFSPNFVPMYFNQSGPLVPLLCNPFHYDFTKRECDPGEVDLTNATEEWRSYICAVNANGICTTPGRLTPTFYDQMSSGISISNGLNNYTPFLVELQDCTYVRETFSEITREYCPGLWRYSRWVYVGLVLVSISVMLSLIFWVIYGRERKHRVSAKLLMAGVGSSESVQGDKGTE